MTRTSFRITAIVALVGMAITSSLSANAQSPLLPAVVDAAIKDVHESCDPYKATLESGFINRKDINGDGKIDHVLDYAEVLCDGSSSFYCGSAGCMMKAFVTQSNGNAVMVFEGNVQAAEFKMVKGKPALILGLHGSSCSRSGADECNKTLFWNGKQFRASR